ncbi:MAG: hypothetical protein ACUVQP_06635 [Bacteroidales bacterium]
MALENSKVENSVEKSDEERVVIAKEVIIKALLPVVFGNTYAKEEREEVFGH